MRTTTRSRLVRLAFGALAVAGLALGGSVAAPAPAEASIIPCKADRICFYFNSDLGGARANLFVNDGALNNELFDDGGKGLNGWAVQVGNNAASVWNNTYLTYRLYDGQSCTGDYVEIRPYSRGNLGDLKNRVSSMKRVSGPGSFGVNQLCPTNVDQSKY